MKSLQKLQYIIKEGDNDTFSIITLKNNSQKCEKIYEINTKYETEIPEPLKLGVPIESITCVILPQCNLSYFPPEFQFCNLIELDISHNIIKEVPTFLLSSNSDLQKLNLSFNSIESFNETPPCYKNIKYLNISSNFLNEFPEWIFNSGCISLENLNLSRNPLQASTLLSGSSLINLKYLELNNSNLKKSFAEVIPNLHKLSINNIDNNYCLNTIKGLPFKNSNRTIVELHMQCLGLCEVSEEICYLNNLEILNLSLNHISWLPQYFTKLKSLKILNISNNELFALPSDTDELHNLIELHLAHNMIGSLPQSLTNLKHLKLLDCYYNDLIEDSLITVKNIPSLVAFDIEQNSFTMIEEPNYLEKRNNIWKNKIDRIAGCRLIYTSDDNTTYTSSISLNEDENDYESGDNIEIVTNHVAENWDCDTDNIEDDSMLVLPPYKFRCIQKIKLYDPSDNVDPIYFEDAIEDDT